MKEDGGIFLRKLEKCTVLVCSKKVEQSKCKFPVICSTTVLAKKRKKKQSGEGREDGDDDHDKENMKSHRPCGTKPASDKRSYPRLPAPRTRKAFRAPSHRRRLSASRPKERINSLDQTAGPPAITGYDVMPFEGPKVIILLEEF